MVTKLAEAVRQEVPDNTSLSLKAGLLEEQARASLRELREIIQFLDSQTRLPIKKSALFLRWQEWKASLQQ